MVSRLGDETAGLDAMAIWVHGQEFDFCHERGDPRLVCTQERSAKIIAASESMRSFLTWHFLGFPINRPTLQS